MFHSAQCCFCSGTDVLYEYYSLNINFTVGSALGIGMLVDNSIVVIENIYRLRGEGYSIRKAAVEGASQVTGAITASTLTTVCVFAPINFYRGYHKTVICGYCADNCIYACSQPARGIDFRADDGSRIIKKYKRDQA